MYHGSSSPLAFPHPGGIGLAPSVTSAAPSLFFAVHLSTYFVLSLAKMSKSTDFLDPRTDMARDAWEEWDEVESRDTRRPVSKNKKRNKRARMANKMKNMQFDPSTGQMDPETLKKMVAMGGGNNAFNAFGGFGAGEGKDTLFFIYFKEGFDMTKTTQLAKEWKEELRSASIPATFFPGPDIKDNFMVAQAITGELTEVKKYLLRQPDISHITIEGNTFRRVKVPDVDEEDCDDDDKDCGYKIVTSS